MNRKPFAVAIISLMAVVLGAAWTWAVLEVRHQREFYALRDQGAQVVREFEALRPAGLSLHEWEGSVGMVEAAWANIFFAPQAVKTEKVKTAIEELRRLKAATTPGNSVERLNQVFDLLLRNRPEKEHYISGMRESYRYNFPQFHTDEAAAP